MLRPCHVRADDHQQEMVCFCSLLSLAAMSGRAVQPVGLADAGLWFRRHRLSSSLPDRPGFGLEPGASGSSGLNAASVRPWLRFRQKFRRERRHPCSGDAAEQFLLPEKRLRNPLKYHTCAARALSPVINNGELPRFVAFRFFPRVPPWYQNGEPSPCQARKCGRLGSVAGDGREAG